VQGLAKNPSGATLILGSAEGDSYVVSAPKDCNVQSGSQVCALITLGENCTVSLTDLRLAAVASLQAVQQKEQLMVEAAKKTEARKKASLRALTQVRTTQDPPSRDGSTVERGVSEDLYTAYRKAVLKFNPRLSSSEADAITASILEFSRRHNVDPRLVMAIILAESHFNPNAVSRAGAMGLGQLMPGTAKGLGVSNAYDPVANIEAAIRLIKGNLTKYSGSKDWNDVDWSHIQLALASYNAGPGAVKKYGGVPPYRETQGYIKKVISYYKKFCGIN
jgi:soluble lytic murein transglycosylase-like protein